MGRRIVIIQGHPDPKPEHLCHGLADAYAAGALEAGHELRFIKVAELDFPLLRVKDDWESKPAPACIQKCQEDLKWAEHVVILHPLWLGMLPALLKGFFEQLLRPGFALSRKDEKAPWVKNMQGRSARVIVTMGMPGFVYFWFYGAYSLRAFKRNVLAFCGFGPLTSNLVGGAEMMDGAKRAKWLELMRALGRWGK